MFLSGEWLQVEVEEFKEIFVSVELNKTSYVVHHFNYPIYRIANVDWKSWRGLKRKKKWLNILEWSLQTKKKGGWTLGILKDFIFLLSPNKIYVLTHLYYYWWLNIFKFSLSHKNFPNASLGRTLLSLEKPFGSSLFMLETPYW